MVKVSSKLLVISHKKSFLSLLLLIIRFKLGNCSLSLSLLLEFHSIRKSSQKNGGLVNIDFWMDEKFELLVGVQQQQQQRRASLLPLLLQLPHIEPPLKGREEDSNCTYTWNLYKRHSSRQYSSMNGLNVPTS